MTPWPAAGAGAPVLAWRLDHAYHAASWDSGIGAEKYGGRWNSRGLKAVYCAVDPSTATLEVAVHKGFQVLDTVAHVITAFAVNDPADVFLVQPNDLPNPVWLRPGTPGAGQQQFGDGLLASRRFVLIPSTVSSHSWNLIFNPANAAGRYAVKLQEPFALDTRLNREQPDAGNMPG